MGTKFGCLLGCCRAQKASCSECFLDLSLCSRYWRELLGRAELLGVIGCNQAFATLLSDPGSG